MPFDPSRAIPDTPAPSEPTPPSPTGRFNPSRAVAVAPEAAAETGFTVPKLARTLAQGWVLDPVEGAAQMAGHLPYVGSTLQGLVPQGVSDWTTQFEKEATAEPWQQYFRLGADIVNPLFMIPGVSELGLGRLAEAAQAGRGLASTVGRAALGGAGRRGAAAGAAAATLQPEEQGDFSWGKKALEATFGSLLGGPLGYLAGRAGERAAGEAANLADMAVHEQRMANWEPRAQAHAAQVLQDQQRATLHDAVMRHYDQQKAVHAATVQNWGTPQHYHPFNLEQYRDILAPIGREADAPTTVGIPELNKVRTVVGDELNRINEQLSFNAHDPDFLLHAGTVRDQTAQELMHESTQRQWFAPNNPNSLYQKYVFDPIRKHPQMSGSQFQEYVSSIDKQADRLADTNPANPYYQDNLKMASALRDVSDRIMEHTTPLAGPQEWPRLKAARDNARQSYYRWSIMNDATKAQRGGVAKPSDMIGAEQRRIGRTRYGQTWGPRKQAWQDHMTRLEGPAPVGPPSPGRAPRATAGSPPDRPTAPTPRPPLPPTIGERVARRAGPVIGGSLGYSAAHQLGASPYLGTAFGAGLGTLLDPLAATLGRAPSVLGRPGGEIGGTAADILAPPDRNRR